MKAIARWLVVSVVLQGTAWAQIPYVPDQNRVPGCQRPERIAVADWNTLNYEQQRAECQKGRPSESQWPLAQSKVDPPMVAPKLALTGLFSAAIGGSLLWHWGSQDVRFLGDTYCVSDYGDVDYGRCGTDMERQIGLIMIGSGALLMWYGARTKKGVTVAPYVSHRVKAVTAKVVW